MVEGPLGKSKRQSALSTIRSAAYSPFPTWEPDLCLIRASKEGVNRGARRPPQRWPVLGSSAK